MKKAIGLLLALACLLGAAIAEEVELIPGEGTYEVDVRVFEVYRWSDKIFCEDGNGFWYSLDGAKDRKVNDYLHVTFRDNATKDNHFDDVPVKVSYIGSSNPPY